MFLFHRADEGQEVPGFQFHLGPVRLGWTEVYVGFMSVLMIQPVIMTITQIFKSVKTNPPIRFFTALNEDVTPVEEREGCTLPTWMRYIAWFLVGASILSSASVCFLYSLQWGGDKSKEWLGAIVMSLLEPLLLVDPFVVSKRIEEIGMQFSQQHFKQIYLAF